MMRKVCIWLLFSFVGISISWSAQDPLADSRVTAVKRSAADREGRFREVRLLRMDQNGPRWIRVEAQMKEERPGDPSSASTTSEAEMAGDELLVRLQPGAKRGDLERALHRVRAQVRREIRGPQDCYLIGFDGSQIESFDEVLSALRSETNVVLHAEPNGIYRLDLWPNDPYMNENPINPDLWQWGMRRIHATQAWDFTTGSSNVVIAVLDTGVSWDTGTGIVPMNADLRNNIWRNTDEIPGNGVDDDRNGYVDDTMGYDFIDEYVVTLIDPRGNEPNDRNGHGTIVSGVAGAEGNNGISVAGVCWKCSLMTLQCAHFQGYVLDAGAIEAVYYAISNGAHVLNASWSSSSSNSLLYAAMARAAQSGIVIVASSGNDAKNNDVEPKYPACFSLSNIISVTAIDYQDVWPSFAGYGRTNVDLAAPGVSIITVLMGAADGVSMAVPHVSGAAALLMTARPNLKARPDLIRSVILDHVSRIDVLTNRVASGGVLDVGAAMASDYFVEIRARAVRTARGWPVLELKIGNEVRARWTVTNTEYGVYSTIVRPMDLVGRTNFLLVCTNDVASGLPPPRPNLLYRELYVDSVYLAGVEEQAEGAYVTFDRGLPFDGVDVVSSSELISTNGALRFPTDPDGDGLNGFAETDAGTDPFSSDTDIDGMPDGWEVANGLDPLVNDASDDPDGDGLINLGEYLLGRNPASADPADEDGDGLTIAQEYLAGTDPRRADTDGDGMKDGFEVTYDFDPLRGGTTDAAAWWKCNEGGSTNLWDATTNANRGTMSNMTVSAAWTAGISYYGVRMDGVDDFVQVPDKACLKPLQVAVSAWIRPEMTYSTGSVAFVCKEAAGLAAGYHLRYYDGRLDFMIGNWSRHNSLLYPCTLQSGRWYHVAGTYDGSVHRLYLDGVPVAESNCAITIYHTNTPVRLGAEISQGTLNFKGVMDDVRIYGRGFGTQDVAAIRELHLDSDGDGLVNLLEHDVGTNPRSVDTDSDGLWDLWEINAGLNPAAADTDGDRLGDYLEFVYGTDPKNPDTDRDGMDDLYEVAYHLNPLAGGATNAMAWWKCNEGSSTNVRDATTNLNHGVMSNMVASAAWTTGVASNAVRLDGSNDFIQIKDSVSLRPSYITVSAWIRPEKTYSTGSVAFVCKERPGGPGGYHLRYYNGNLDFLICTRLAYYSLLYPCTLQSGRWYHVAGTYDGAVHRLYLDGVVVAEENRAITLYQTNTPVRLGAETSVGTLNFKGVIDEVRVYGVGLASNAVRGIYEVYADPDGDGIRTIDESRYWTDPHSADTDGDGMPDPWELAHSLDPRVADGSADPDNDCLSNLEEMQWDSDPHVADPCATLYVKGSATNAVEDGTPARPYNTMNEAVLAARAGDRILVATGSYTENVIIAQRTNVVLVGYGTNTVVRHPDQYKFQIVDSRDITLEALRIEGGQEGIFVSASTNVLVQSCLIQNLVQTNYTPLPGAALHCAGASVRWLGNVVRDCYGGQYGGGGCVTGGGLLEVIASHFINCTAWNSGGGFYIAPSSPARRSVLFRGNYFDGNLADNSGAIDIAGSGFTELVADHNVIRRSGADYTTIGGAIKLNSDNTNSTARIVNNVIASVFTNGYNLPAAINVAKKMPVYAANNILFANDYSIYSAYSNQVVAEYNDSFSSRYGYRYVVAGAGSLTVDPKFVNAAAGDYRLQATSPCINAGHPDPSYNDPDGSRNDMGAYGGPW